MHMIILERMYVTMMEEKRGLIGKKTCSASHIAEESSIGISDSNTPRTLTQRTELFRYWADGLTGSSSISSLLSFSLSAVLVCIFSFICFIFLKYGLKYGSSHICLYSLQLQQDAHVSSACGILYVNYATGGRLLPLTPNL